MSELKSFSCPLCGGNNSIEISSFGYSEDSVQCTSCNKILLITISNGKIQEIKRTI